MNTIAKLIAPVALAFAAFGAQASEIAPGDIGFKPVMVGTAASMSVSQGARGGELAAGDIGTQSITAAKRTVSTTDRMAQPLRTTIVVGA